jgi:hypothetical protein
MSRALQLPLLLDAITRGHHRRRRSCGGAAAGAAPEPSGQPWRELDC